MTIIDIFSGFLGAGKTTLIQKLIREGYTNEKLVLIENEFGEIGIDSGFLKEAGIQITEMNAGCICCSLVGNFQQALVQVIEQYSPDRVIIEPSGVGKLSDVIAAVKFVCEKDSNLQLGCFITVADATKAKLYTKNFGEFYNDQIENAQTIILSRTQNILEQKLQETFEILRKANPTAAIITTPWEQLTAEQILQAGHNYQNWKNNILSNTQCDCNDHHHDHQCGCGDHHHDHQCGCGDHHHAEQVFSSIAQETTQKYTKEEIEFALTSLDSGDFGTILRAKGIVETAQGEWLHFDYVPGESNVRIGSSDVTGRLCIIGSGLNTEGISALFRL